MLNKTAAFAKERETKGAVLYREVNAQGATVPIVDAIIGSLYMRKSAFDGDIPNYLTVTVSSGKPATPND